MNVYPGDGTLNQKAPGVIVRCDAEKCPVNENVFGYGKNEKEAHSIACQKYKKS